MREEFKLNPPPAPSRGTAKVRWTFERVCGMTFVSFQVYPPPNPLQRGIAFVSFQVYPPPMEDTIFVPLWRGQGEDLLFRW